MTFDIKLFAIQENNAWFRSGWSALVDNYREYQHAVKEQHGTLSGKEVAVNLARFDAALEVLVRQAADALAVPPQDVYPVVKGYLYECCGFPDSPKGLDTWLAQ